MNNKSEVIDLTHTISPEIPTFDGTCGFQSSIAVDYKDCIKPNLFRVQKIEAKAGIGTHMDAPAHCIPSGKTIGDLSIESLMVDCVVIRVDETADENYSIMPSAIETFEAKHGEIAPNTFIIFYSGWDQFWNTPQKYINNYKFPSVHISTAKILLSRDIAGIGTDTLSADTGPKDFPVHQAILGAGKYLVENIANADKFPSVGAKVLVLPMKIKNATEAPIRLVALT